MDVVAREEVDNAVVISAEEVADYVTTLDADKDLIEIVDRVAPPFAKMFVEFQRRPNNLKLDSWGVLLSGERNGHDGWALRVAPVGEWKRGHPVGPLIRSGVLVDASGHIRSSEDIADELFGSDRPGDRTNLWPVMTEVPDLPEETTYSFARSAFYLVAPALFAISLMHCKNVGTRPVDPPERLSRKHERKHGRGLTRYYVLDIAPMRQILDTEGEARTRGLRTQRTTAFGSTQRRSARITAPQTRM